MVASVRFICLKQCTAHYAGAARPSGDWRPSCLELTRWWLIAWSGAAVIYTRQGFALGRDPTKRELIEDLLVCGSVPSLPHAAVQDGLLFPCCLECVFEGSQFACLPRRQQAS